MVKVSIVGYGYWGPNLLRNFFDNQNCEVIYCCDQDIHKLKPVRKRYPTVMLTSSYDDILKDDDVDAVIIATPTISHFPLAKEALLAGKDVLIEKPMVLSGREADELLEIAKKNKRIVMVDHTFLYNSAVLQIKKLIDGGEIGDILYMDSVRANLGLFQKDVNVVYDLASHDFSIIQYLLGSKPVSVSAHGDSHFGKQEDVAYVIARYSKKTFAHVHVSWLSPAKVRRFLVIGTKKMVVYDDMESSEKVKVYDKGVFFEQKGKAVQQLKIGYRSGDVWIPKIDVVEPLSSLVNDFINSVEKRTTPVSSGRLGGEVVSILEQATKSIRKK